MLRDHHHGLDAEPALDELSLHSLTRDITRTPIRPVDQEHQALLETLLIMAAGEAQGSRHRRALSLLNRAAEITGALPAPSERLRQDLLRRPSSLLGNSAATL